MRFMVIENGIAVNAILAESADAVPGLTLVQSDTANIGDLWDGQTFTAPPPPPIDFPAVRAAKVAEIKAERDRRTREGGVPAGGKWFHSDVYTRSQFHELARRGSNIPPIPWRTMDGTDITMTPALVLEILDSFFAQELGTFQRGKELEFFANTEPNPGGLVLNGWPPIYGE